MEDLGKVDPGVLIFSLAQPKNLMARDLEIVADRVLIVAVDHKGVV